MYKSLIIFSLSASGIPNSRFLRFTAEWQN